ncbi:hypothetical protein P344_02255 [Spiroplasma mirum ATCC 29335]|uniref:Uncharacterized protein n=1 Tax=Spiroplasma mirum ATCC 29335 TaxID=838561 RepID=W6AVR2_9MOLU|nr:MULTISPECIES: hypothetical protein [Spiroplasma]AHI57799.1 hypothetical protein P344_02255 [Spiroplasma mirum ATCC 29335]AKM52935.1 hypothetical protein SATRI_v1c04290 [Spiroplasma atrichopogonis]
MAGWLSICLFLTFAAMVVSLVIWFRKKRIQKKYEVETSHNRLVRRCSFYFIFTCIGIFVILLTIYFCTK